MRAFDGQLLIALDGTQYHQSNSIRCNHCTHYHKAQQRTNRLRAFGDHASDCRARPETSVDIAGYSQFPGLSATHRARHDECQVPVDPRKTAKPQNVLPPYPGPDLLYLLRNLQCLARLHAAQLELISQCVAHYPCLSREELAATVCEWLNWRRANGGLKTRGCRDLLQQLQEQTLFELPALCAGRPRGAATQILHTQQGNAKVPPHCALSAVRSIRLKQVEQPAEQRLWRELVERYHYLGYRTAYGASLRYLIEATSPQPGILGCLQFSSPAWLISARDRWIGWNDVNRKQLLSILINNSRFLIPPWVHIPNLASHVLAVSAYCR